MFVCVCYRCWWLGQSSVSADTTQYVARSVTEVFARSISGQSATMRAHSASAAVAALHQCEGGRQIPKLCGRRRRQNERHCSGNDQLVLASGTELVRLL